MQIIQVIIVQLSAWGINKQAFRKVIQSTAIQAILRFITKQVRSLFVSEEGIDKSTVSVTTSYTEDGKRIERVEIKEKGKKSRPVKILRTLVFSALGLTITGTGAGLALYFGEIDIAIKIIVNQ